MCSLFAALSCCNNLLVAKIHFPYHCVGLFLMGTKHVALFSVRLDVCFMDILWSVVENPKLILLHQMIGDSVLKTETSDEAW